MSVDREAFDETKVAGIFSIVRCDYGKASVVTISHLSIKIKHYHRGPMIERYTKRSSMLTRRSSNAENPRRTRNPAESQRRCDVFRIYGEINPTIMRTRKNNRAILYLISKIISR